MLAHRTWKVASFGVDAAWRTRGRNYYHERSLKAKAV